VAVVQRFLPRPFPRTAIKLAVTAAIFAYLFSILDVREIPALVSRAKPHLLLLSFAVFVSRNIFGALRNKVLLAYKSFDFSLAALVRLYFIGFFFNLFLPTVVGGDIARGYYLYTYSGGKEETISSILVERALGILAMMFLSVVSIALAEAVGLNVVADRTIKVIFCLFGAGLVLSLLFFCERTERVLERALPERLTRKFRSPMNVVLHVIKYNKAPSVLLYAFVLSLLFQFLSIVSTYLISSALGSSMDFLYFLMLLPVIWLISMVPISINGLGLREGSFVFLFGAAGMQKETAMTISVIWLAQTILLGVMGGIAFLAEGTSLSAIRNHKAP